MLIGDIENGDAWSQDFLPEDAVGEPLADSDWIDAEAAYEWPDGNGESWGFDLDEEEMIIDLWSYNDDSEGVDDWEEDFEYTFHWMESDDGEWDGFELPLTFYAYDGAQKLVAAAAVVSLFGLMM